MKRANLLTAGILLLALGLRLYKIGEMALRADEAANVLLAAVSPAEIIRPFITLDPHLPLYHLVLHFWMLVAGQTELAVRFPAVFSGVLVVALTFRLARNLFRHSLVIALIAAFLVAISPYLVWDAQEAYMYSALTALTLAALVAFSTVTTGGEHAGVGAWIAYVAANAIGLYVHYLAALALLAQVAVAIYLWWRRGISSRTCRAAVIAQIAAVALFLPWLAVTLPLLTSFKLDFFPAVSLFELLERTGVAFSAGRLDGRLMPAMVDPVAGNLSAVIFLVVFLIGLAARANSERQRRTALVIYLVVPLAALFVFSVWRFPIYDERYILFLIPPYLLIVARGLAALMRRLPRVGAAAAFALVLAASGNSLFNYFYVPAYAKSPDWHGFVGALVSEARPGDVLIQNYPDPALPYYLDGRLPRVLLPRTGDASAADVAVDLARLTGKYERIWLQPVAGGAWDYDGLVQTWLDRHAREAAASRSRGLELELYLPAPVALRQATPVDAVFASIIQLLAYEWDAPAGRLVLYWQSILRSEQNATVFVHLYDKDGKLWSQRDSIPVRGTYPTRDWTPLEVVVDTYDLRLPAGAPEGTYSIMVGMYDSQTLERLPVTGSGISESRVLLTTVAHRANEGRQ